LKRSEYIALGAVGLLVVATVWPRSPSTPPAPNDPGIATGDGFQTLAFASLDECRNAQVVTAATCDTQFREAQGASIEDAPKFAALDKCEAEFGANACRPALWQGASVFVPALAGVLIARSLMNNQTSGQPLYPPRTGPAACPPGASAAQQPECQTRSASSSSSTGSGSSGRSYYSTGSGRTIGRVAGAVLVDTVLSSRTYANTSSTGGGWSAGRSGSSVATVARSSGSSIGTSSRPTSSSMPSSSSTTSRSGFGSTGRSFSSSSS
jgi:Protein of unknown function (DUF1190)